MANSIAVAHAGWDRCEVVEMNLRVLVYEGMAYHGAAGHDCSRYGNHPFPNPTPSLMSPQQPIFVIS